MSKLLVIAALVTIAAADPIPWVSRSSPKSPQGKIVGGTEVSIEEVPYQVVFMVSGMSTCGGSIISREWVVTAAHCMGYPKFMYTLRAGSNRANNGGTKHALAKVIIHEDYKIDADGIPEHDIALVKVKTPFTFDSTRRPISLYNLNEEVEDGANSVITGWGVTSIDGQGSDILHTVNVPIISKQDCKEAYSSQRGLPEGQICAAYPDGGQDACQGDSGGPLVVAKRLAGVVSWGNGCAIPGYPGVYSEVAYYRSWIARNSGI
ncbi:trypsin-3 [Orussus abietinus]|uniref:trypsin-3 n=1 Tax=Orussus abietinus TaxID=222816 RepID=UPI00062617FA|nr:trypsin-3 [Orussus abietinus]